MKNKSKTTVSQDNPLTCYVMAEILPRGILCSTKYNGCREMMLYKNYSAEKAIKLFRNHLLTLD